MKKKYKIEKHRNPEVNQLKGKVKVYLNAN